MKLVRSAGALALVLSLAACGVNPAGYETIGGIATPIKGTQVAVAAADVQTAIAALPALCQDFAVAAALTQAEIGVLQQVTKLPARTVSNISNASAKGLLLCQGTQAVVSPLAAAPASP